MWSTASGNKLKAFTDELGNPVFVIDVCGTRPFRMLCTNARHEETTGIAHTQIAGHLLEDFCSPELAQNNAEHYQHCVDCGCRVEYEECLHLPDGVRWWQTTLTPIRDDEGRIVRILGNGIDVTDRKILEMSLRHQAHFDVLTGLHNRTGFMDRLHRAFAHAKRHFRPLALLFLDLDRLKCVNDNHGHSAGDELLKQFGTRLKQVVRQTDTVARLAGDEFVILLEELKDARDDAITVAEKALRAMEAPICLAQIELVVSTSIGVALLSEDILDPESLIKRADTAMYQAKHNGSGGYRIL
jgi:diguanylate cyclase (GGDEF)-like protein/PAS domain S-box-containing protein